MKRLLMCLLAAMVLLGAAMGEENNRYDALEYPGQPGYAAVQRDGLWGIVDRTGALMIPCEWDDMEQWQWPFMWSEIVAMSRDGQTAFLNTQGELVTGRLHPRGEITALYRDDILFLLENGVLSIWQADGTKVY